MPVGPNFHLFMKGRDMNSNDPDLFSAQDTLRELRRHFAAINKLLLSWSQTLRSRREQTGARIVGMIQERSPETVREYRERLLSRMREILEGTQIDESRILTEAAIFADRTAVDEETVRLKSHITQMRETLELDVPAGRKLDFIVQEMNREANTIASKCNDGQLTRVVLEIKSEIEKIREQIQNIE